jgi:anthranilate/para-aminobenzoate synthase component I
MINLSKKDFLDEVQKGRIPPLFKEVPYSDPFHFYRSFTDRGNSIFLDSAKVTSRIARYSFIAADPYLTFRLKDGEVEIGDIANGLKTLSFRNPLERLNELLAVYPQNPDPGLPPFQGGAVGLFSYDFARHIERLPDHALDDLRIPEAHFLFADMVYAFDHVLKKAWVICAPGAGLTGLGYKDITDIDWAVAYEEALEKIVMGASKYAHAKALSGLGPDVSASGYRGCSEADLRYEMSKAEYMDIVRRTKEYIAAGDIFQANLSQRISADIGDADPWPIYEVLRRVNPSPFAVYADFGDYRIASSSPERLISARTGVIETRPIAGTRPRGRDSNGDSFMRAELLLNEKERAEHIMLIDLERNDIGRVSRYGSVMVDELMTTEDYSHVIHIVSNVKGIVKEGMTCLDVVRATFPGGTITGVPKVRCMEIIDELEPVRRGPYTGSMGYIGFSGDMDLNIIIRTFTIKDGRAYIQAGAGIVADSDPEREYYETMKKAEALVKTLNTLGITRIK